MFDMPDWYQKYQSKDAWGSPMGMPFAPASALSTGLPSAAPVAPAPAPPPADPNAAMRAMVMSGQVDPGASGGFTSDPTVGPGAGSFSSPPMPPVRPQNPTVAMGNVPMPPPRPGGNWDTTTALEGDPQASPLPDWATPGAQTAAASEGRQIGPGSWMNPEMMGKMINPNSLVGRMLSMRNPSAAPQAEKQQGLLSGLFADGGMFGRDPTTPNSTTGGLW